MPTISRIAEHRVGHLPGFRDDPIGILLDGVLVCGELHIGFSSLRPKTFVRGVALRRLPVEPSRDRHELEVCARGVKNAAQSGDA